ncbi:MAG: alpha/beta hydrolase [Salibacteraceae bacterium]
MDHTLKVSTEGRYYTLGEGNPINKSVWFVFHGYGMRAEDFIKEFDCIDDGQTLIVAPEGLHRFYSRGTRGKVSSSWMTSDLREFDIANNIDFLNLVLQEIEKLNVSDDYKIGVLGFSQGAPTSVRWVSNLVKSVSELVVWGSDMPVDVIDKPVNLKKINNCDIKLVIGSHDEYISSDQTDDLIMDLHDKGVEFDFHSFEGKHEIHYETVRYFHARLMDDKLEY